jgi:HD-like signal output (HDOD) protein
MPTTSVASEELVRLAQELPIAPRILAQIGLLLRDINTPSHAVLELLQRDAALTARILRVSNSAAYASESRIASLDDAILRVGFSEVYRLTAFAAAAQVASQHLPTYGVSAALFRENSLLTALIMERLAPVAGIDSQHAYVAGLMRSIGKLALDRLFRAHGETGSFDLDARGPLTDWEMQLGGTTNCEAAATILDLWRFPAEIGAAIRDHYQPAPDAALAQCLHLAAAAADRCGHGWPGENSYWQPVEAFAALSLDAEQCDAAMRGALENFGPVRAALA